MSEIVRLPAFYINWLEINVTNGIPLPHRIRDVVHEYSVPSQTTSPSPDISVTPVQQSDLSLFISMLIVGMAVTITISVIGSIGNLLTLSTLVNQFRMPSRKRYLPKITSDTILILNLCVADFCYSAISLPVMFVNYKNLYFHAEEAATGDYQALSNRTCKWAAFLRYANAITEWTTLGIMALERCITIYRFQRKMAPSRLFTPTRAIWYCLVLWVIGMAVQTLTLTEKYGEFGYNKDTLKCDFMPETKGEYFVSPRVFFFAMESAVPCFCILVGYIIILTQVYSSKHFFRGNNSLTSATQLSMALRRSKTTRLIVLLLTMYLVCVIPICIYNVVIHEDHLGETKNQIIGIALYCLYWVQYAANNFIYVVSNEKYRKAYHQFFSLILCKDIPSPSQMKYLKISNQLTGLTIHKEIRSMRLRSPSEMTLDCTYSNGSFKASQTQTKVSFIATNLKMESLKEFPILVFPKTQLQRIGSSIKRTRSKYKCRRLTSLNKGKHLNFDFRWSRRRLSLDVTKEICIHTRKRSLSI